MLRPFFLIKEYLDGFGAGGGGGVCSVLALRNQNRSSLFERSLHGHLCIQIRIGSLLVLYVSVDKTITMLIHGKLHLTASHLNLDEVRSLLQKSLRRKETDLVLKSCKELIGNLTQKGFNYMHVPKRIWSCSIIS